MNDIAAPWIELFGRLHPLALHLPIGLLAGLALMEVVAILRRKVVPREITRSLVVLIALSSVLAAGTGYILGREGETASITLIRHQQLGIALAVACVLAAIVHLSSPSPRAYRAMLLVCVLLLAPVGHLGGSMTHGDAFLTAPLARVFRATALALDPAGGAAGESAYAKIDVPPAVKPAEPVLPAVEPAAPIEIIAPSVAPKPAAPPALQPTPAEPAPVVAEKPRELPPVATPVVTPVVASAVTVAAVRVSEPDLFVSRVQPILESSCTGCHGGERQRGGLALHTLAALTAGGKSGPGFLAGRPEESEIVRRLRLPEGDKKRMPPAGKPQLTDEQIKVIESWIAGEKSIAASPIAVAQAAPAPVAPVPVAPISDSVAPVAPSAPVLTPASVVPPAPPALAVAVTPPPAVVAALPIKPSALKTAATTLLPNLSPPSAAALQLLGEHLVHFEGAARDSNLLTINFAAASAKTDDALAHRLLEPILPNLDTLALSQCKVGDPTAVLLAGASRLKRLDLRGTAVSDAGVAAIKALPQLEELVLVRTRLTDAAVEHLASMPNLQRAYVWNAGLSAKGIADLQARRPDLYVNTGTFQEAVAKEVEGEIKLTSDAPPPGQAAQAVQAVAAVQPAKPADLKPINTVCPVTGGPVDPRIAVVHKNRVIGFCCPKCPAAFWADAAKYESKLPPAEAVAVAGD